jgi:spermidine synthase
LAYAARTKPWVTLASATTTATAGEGVLELRKRGESEFLIVIGGRVLMNSASQRSEQALAELALADRAANHVIIGGLGMGFTLRAALDKLGPSAHVIVGELDPTIVEWCRGPLAAASGHALEDRRVEIVLGDVDALIARSQSIDAIMLDLYEGPYESRGCFGARGLVAIHRALAPAGVLAVWSEDPAPSFVGRLERAGFGVKTHRVGSNRRHIVYCAAPRPPRDFR